MNLSESGYVIEVLATEVERLRKALEATERERDNYCFMLEREREKMRAFRENQKEMTGEEIYNAVKLEKSK